MVASRHASGERLPASPSKSAPRAKDQCAGHGRLGLASAHVLSSPRSRWTGLRSSMICVVPGGCMTVKSLRIAAAFCAAAAISAAASAVMLSAAGQQSSANPSYTAEQARAGQPAFQANCATCHGADLLGSPYAPPLAGRGFADAWSTRSVRDLFESIRTMPPTNPRLFDDDARLNLAAYILQVNGMAPGPARLMPTAADALASLKASRPAASAANSRADTPSGPPPCPEGDPSRTAPNSARRGRWGYLPVSGRCTAGRRRTSATQHWGRSPRAMSTPSGAPGPRSFRAEQTRPGSRCRTG